jgi:hypothetical protein
MLTSLDVPLKGMKDLFFDEFLGLSEKLLGTELFYSVVH